MTSAGCEGFKPIRGTHRDSQIISDKLAASILAHNEYGREVCGWRP